MVSLTHTPDGLSFVQKLPTLSLGVCMVSILIAFALVHVQPKLPERLVHVAMVLPLVPLLLAVAGYAAAYATSGSVYILYP